MSSVTFELGFAKFIERFHEPIKEAFLEDACEKREILAHYQLGRTVLQTLADDILSEFARNIDRKTSVEAIADKYVAFGSQCAQDGLRSSDMVRALILLKRHIWLFFQENNFAGQPFDVRSIIALNNRTALFFDRAIYYVLVGFEQAGPPESSDLEALYRVFLKKVKQDLGRVT